MHRRVLLRSAGGLALAALMPAPVQARLACTPAPVVQFCEAGIDSTVAHVTAAMVNGQHQKQWCWAACIEMVFRYYGFLIPQERIVAETFGSIQDFPGNPQQILANLNRSWEDENGAIFSVFGDVFSANPLTAAQDLSQDMPLIIGSMGHAMVLSALTYQRYPNGAGEVKAAVVRDPWPGNGRRVLSAQEWYSTSFLVRIRVT